MGILQPLKRALSLSCLLGLFIQPSWADEGQQQALDKAYQQVLFHYFQGDFFQALSQFSRLEGDFPGQLDKISNPGISPELLKGGISLAHGLEEQASDIFTRLLANDQPPEIQTQAWWLLGKTLFHKQLFNEAASALANINEEMAEDYLDESGRDELVYLRSQLFDLADDAQLADVNWLDQLSDGSVYRDYVTYNQGLAQLRSQQTQLATQTLSNLGEPSNGIVQGWFSGWWSPIQTFDDEEFSALRDRANLTLGYTYLQQGQVTDAMGAFNRVRLDSLDTQAALLGYGWAAAKDEQFTLALSIWQQLQQMPDTSEYVMEAYLAGAFAFEQASAPQQALSTLQSGMRRYAAERSALLSTRDTLSEGFIIELANVSGESDQSSGHLSAILLSKAVRIQLSELQENLTLERRLRAWLQQMETFDVMLNEREQEADRRAEALSQNATLEQLAALKAQRESLAQLVQQARSSQSGELLRNEQELAWQARLSRAQQRHQSIVATKQALQDKPLNPSYQQRLARVAGILLWESSESLEARLWEAQKALNQVDISLAKTTAQQSILQGHLNKPAQFPAQRQRIAALKARLNTQWQAQQTLKQNQLASLRMLLTQHLDKQLAQVQQYQLQAQLAIVRLQDQSFRQAQAEERQGGQSNGH